MATETLLKSERSKDVRHKNIAAGIAVADTVRTSLGPKGMDKMIQDGKGGVIITNDGATIMNKMNVTHPIAKMLVDVSKTQDIEAGDGTTSVVIITGALLRAAEFLLDKGIHPQQVAESFKIALEHALKILQENSIPLQLDDRETLIKNASTSLNSKVVSQSSALLAPIAVDCVLRIYDPSYPSNIDLNQIRVVKKLGGTVDDTQLIDGLVFANNKIAKAANGPVRVQNAKIGLIQFCLSPPKTNLENNITIKDYASMDRLLREERLIIAKMVKQIQQTGCNVLLVQKSILRDAITDLSMDFLAKAKILLVRDIERDDIEFVSKTLNCQPVACIEDFTADKLGNADLVCEQEAGGHRVTYITGVPSKSASSVLVRASNQLMLDEAERSLHDALCVVRALVKKQAILPGGSAPEMLVSTRLFDLSQQLSGSHQLCIRAYAEALEVIPYTLAENCGLHPIDIVAQLRKMHSAGKPYSGINVKKGIISDMLIENVVQPLLVSTSALTLATETVMMILKIDDVVMCR